MTWKILKVKVILAVMKQLKQLQRKPRIERERERGREGGREREREQERERERESESARERERDWREREREGERERYSCLQKFQPLIYISILYIYVHIWSALWEGYNLKKHSWMPKNHYHVQL